MDISFLQGTVSGLKIASDIAKGLIETKKLSEIGGKVIELQSAILSAQSNALTAQAVQASMVEKIRELQEEMARVKAWEEEKQRFSLVAPMRSVLVYAVKKECARSEPPHWICTLCYEDGRKTILNQVRGKESSFWHIVCPVCKSQIDTNYKSAYPPQYAEDTKTE